LDAEQQRRIRGIEPAAGHVGATQVLVACGQVVRSDVGAVPPRRDDQFADGGGVAQAEIQPLRADRGHDIGSHAFWHHDAWLVPVRNVASVVRGCREIARLPNSSRLYRPPNGRATTWSYLAAKACGFRHAYWTVDSLDWVHPPGAIDAVVAEVRRNGGGVVLMHDLETGEAGEAQRHRHLLALTRQLIALGKREGWDIGPMSELMNERKRGTANA